MRIEYSRHVETSDAASARVALWGTHAGKIWLAWRLDNGGVYGLVFVQHVAGFEAGGYARVRVAGRTRAVYLTSMCGTVSLDSSSHVSAGLYWAAVLHSQAEDSKNIVEFWVYAGEDANAIRTWSIPARFKLAPRIQLYETCELGGPYHEYSDWIVADYGRLKRGDTIVGLSAWCSTMQALLRSKDGRARVSVPHMRASAEYLCACLRKLIGE